MLPNSTLYVIIFAVVFKPAPGAFFFPATPVSPSKSTFDLDLVIVVKKVKDVSESSSRHCLVQMRIHKLPKISSSLELQLTNSMI